MSPLQILLAAAATGGLLLVAPAASAQDLSGAWATDGSSCEKIFVKNGNRVVLRDDSELHGGGFVIDGNRIRGKATTCDIKARKIDGPTTHLIASCASDIMLSSVQLSVRMPDPGTLVRIFPGMSGMELTYKRCTL
ncbi:hypothetical protein [Rhodoplanes roseus]|uniref:Uncharacterized protein n=1 Tax=Rhodoplanes roseus TaxID=29409 RepID=A0A327KMP3_9BRAD|nr:hypothetical protein [Rhodoplanes roseus]RAI38833.1 hypothetical protein CH341_27105 [Rhodoplanes roseus]